MICGGSDALIQKKMPIVNFVNVKHGWKGISQSKVFIKNSLRKSDQVKVLENSTEFTMKVLKAEKKLYT